MVGESWQTADLCLVFDSKVAIELLAVLGIPLNTSFQVGVRLLLPCLNFKSSSKITESEILLHSGGIRLKILDKFSYCCTSQEDRD